MPEYARFVESAIWIGAILAPAWWAVDAKPIGRLPYRWGYYLGIEMGLACLVFAQEGFVALQREQMLMAAVLASMAVIAGSAGVGVYCRKRFGVRALVACAALALLLPAAFVLAGAGLRSRLMGEGLLVLVILIASGYYFRRRWHLLR